MTTALPRVQLPPIQVVPHTPSPPRTPPTNRREELAEFAARVCYTLWHGASLSTTSPIEGSASPFSPRSIYYSTPESFLRLVNRTLHPHLSPHVAPVALLYVQRYVTSQRSMPLTPPASPSSRKLPSPGSEARIWCTALLLAMKQNDDRAAAARYWAPARVDEQAGGMTPRELAAMEREFLQGIDWRLRILPEDYAGWLARLRRFKEVMETASTPSTTDCPTTPVTPASTASSIEMPKKRSVDMTTFEEDRRRMFEAANALITIKQRRATMPLAVVYSPPRKRSTCEADVQQRFDHEHAAFSNITQTSILEKEFVSSPEMSSSDESC